MFLESLSHALKYILECSLKTFHFQLWKASSENMNPQLLAGHQLNSQFLLELWKAC